ncbi:MAG: lamin tail domain-containing protein [Tidjanibacter sp.]|nr:lamin tail domain-containing protein [Tidjanibacter sp.]
MKKLFVVLASVAMVACNNNDIQGEDGPNNNGGDNSVSGVVLNELSGADKFIELYNTTDEAINLDGLYLVKYDSSKEGGKSTTWTGKGSIMIQPKGFVVLESSDLADPAEDGDENYAYESEYHIFKGGLSGKKNVFIELYNAKDEKLSEFKRGDEGAGWNQVGGFNNDKKHTFSRVPDGTGEFVYADPTKGAANGAKVADIEQTPEM